MYYATMMMHKPEDHPNDNRDVLILVKDAPNFKIGGISDGAYHVLVDDNYVRYEDAEIDMWCELPTRETINRVHKL